MHINIPLIVIASECVFLAVYTAIAATRGWSTADNATLAFIERIDVVLRIVMKPFLASVRFLRAFVEGALLISPIKAKDDEPSAVGDEKPTFPLTEYNILDLCMRPYQLIAATMDTLNVIAFGVVALAFSVLVVVIELFGEISPELRTTGFVFLAIAVMLTTASFLMGDAAGFRGWVDMFDGRRFLIGYYQLGRIAVLESIEGVIENTTIIGKVRDRKRLMLFVSLLLCIGAAVCFAMGRAIDEKPPASYSCHGSIGAAPHGHAATPSQKLVLECQ